MQGGEMIDVIGRIAKLSDDEALRVLADLPDMLSYNSLCKSEDKLTRPEIQDLKLTAKNEGLKIHITREYTGRGSLVWMYSEVKYCITCLNGTFTDTFLDWIYKKRDFSISFWSAAYIELWL